MHSCTCLHTLCVTRLTRNVVTRRERINDMEYICIIYNRQHALCKHMHTLCVTRLTKNIVARRERALYGVTGLYTRQRTYIYVLYTIYNMHYVYICVLSHAESCIGAVVLAHAWLQQFWHTSICAYKYLYMCKYINMNICMCLCLCLYLSDCLSVCLSDCLSSCVRMYVRAVLAHAWRQYFR